MGRGRQSGDHFWWYLDIIYLLYYLSIASVLIYTDQWTFSEYTNLGGWMIYGTIWVLVDTSRTSFPPSKLSYIFLCSSPFLSLEAADFSITQVHLSLLFQKDTQSSMLGQFSRDLGVLRAWSKTGTQGLLQDCPDSLSGLTAYTVLIIDICWSCQAFLYPSWWMLFLGILSFSTAKALLQAVRLSVRGFICPM